MCSRSPIVFGSNGSMSFPLRQCQPPLGSTLPRDSAILYFLLVVDAAGPCRMNRTTPLISFDLKAMPPSLGSLIINLAEASLGGPLYPYQQVSQVAARVAPTDTQRLPRLQVVSSLYS